jgi:UDP-glucose 4-epimerase
LGNAQRGETYIPRVPSARIIDVARALIGERSIESVITGTRPGEKLHEILISEEEAHRTVRRGEHYVIAPILPEIQGPLSEPALNKEYTSEDDLMNAEQVAALLAKRRLLIGDAMEFEGEFLR